MVFTKLVSSASSNAACCQITVKLVFGGPAQGDCWAKSRSSSLCCWDTKHTKLSAKEPPIIKVMQRTRFVLGLVTTVALHRHNMKMTGVLESFETHRWATLASSRIVAKLIRDEFSFCTQVSDTQVSDTLRGMYSNLSRLCYFNQTFACRCTSTDILVATCRSIKLLKAECPQDATIDLWWTRTAQRTRERREAAWLCEVEWQQSCGQIHVMVFRTLTLLKCVIWGMAHGSGPEFRHLKINATMFDLCFADSSLEDLELCISGQEGDEAYGVPCRVGGWAESNALVLWVLWVLSPLCLLIYDVSGRSTSASILSSGLPNCLWCASEGCLKLRYQVGCYILGSTIQWFLMCSDSHSQHKHGEVWGDAIQVSTISTLY